VCVCVCVSGSDGCSTGSLNTEERLTLNPGPDGISPSDHKISEDSSQIISCSIMLSFCTVIVIACLRIQT